MSDIYNVIKNIRLTEKATLLGEENNEFIFKVDVDATKPQIKNAVQRIFGKTVIGVRTSQVAGKVRRAGRHDTGTTPSWKKAIVRLKDGERIDLV